MKRQVRNPAWSLGAFWRRPWRAFWKSCFEGNRHCARKNYSSGYVALAPAERNCGYSKITPQGTHGRKPECLWFYPHCRRDIKNHRSRYCNKFFLQSSGSCNGGMVRKNGWRAEAAVEFFKRKEGMVEKRRNQLWRSPWWSHLASKFCCNLGTYSTHPIPVPYFIPTGVKFQNRQFNACKENEMETRNVFIQVIKKPARKNGFTLLRATASPQSKFKHLFSRAHLLNP